MNEKQQHLTFDKGITNVPSDFICSDNALQDCVGMTYADGEHKVIQKPAVFMSGCEDYVILFIHKFSIYERYIVTDGQSVMWGVKNTEGELELAEDQWGHVFVLLTTTNTPQVSAIGRTLIISDDNGINYYLWRVDEGDYYELGDIQEPEFSFKLRGGGVAPIVKGGCGYYSAQNEGRMKFDDGVPSVGDEKQTEYNDLVIGTYAKCVNSVENNKEFCKPFFIRYAIELYDGSYTLISNPILLFPAIRTNFIGDLTDVSSYILFQVYSTELLFKADYDYTEWSDIVKNVVVFISDGINLYDTTGDQKPTWLYQTQTPPSGVKVSSIAWDYIIFKYGFQPTSNVLATYGEDPSPSGENSKNYFIPINQREASDIISDLFSTSVFYKAFETGIKSLNTDGWKSSKAFITAHTLENLTTQEQLPYDDFYSRCPLSANSIASYNNRLVLSYVKRGFFDGFSSFISYDYQSSAYTYKIYVYIKAPSGTRIVEKTITNTHEKMGVYFFYPDSRAYRADIFWVQNQSTTSFVKTITLKEHPYLNGAYYFQEHLPDGTEGAPVASTGSEPATRYNKELLSNLLYVSEVNNPFVFRPEGNVTVGNGEILGISNLTTALSQGQFGQYPLIIFTSEGIWAASTGTTGLFTAVHPMSREVCNNPKSITQTDGLIFFSSEKGLMVVSGSVVKCVSEQLSGKSDTPFQDFLKTAVIAYDYRDSLLWIFDAATHQEGGVDVVGSNYCYIYNIKSSTFSRYILDGEVTMKGEAVAHFETFSSLQTHLSELGLTAGDLVLLDSSAGYYESFETEEHIGAPVPTVMEYNAPAPDFTWNIYFPSANEAYLVGNTIWAVTGEEEWRTIRRIRNVVSYYPDFLLQSGDSVLTLLKRPNINSDDTEYFTKITSRPAKLENSLALKTIMQLKNIKQLHGSMTLKIEASNDIENWIEITSLTGIPWKFYRFTYEFSNLKATDTFSGTILITQERRTNKLR